MTKPSSTPVKHASVKVATRICKITVNVTLQHTGGAGDFITIHDRFLNALEVLVSSTIPSDGGDPPSVHINVDMEPLSSTSCGSANDIIADDAASGDGSVGQSSPTVSMPDLGSLTLFSPTNTRPNTPMDLERDVEHDYHIIYGCDVHGPQNHYSPYCGCIPFPLDVSMPPLLPDGTFPPILPNGSILWPP